MIEFAKFFARKLVLGVISLLLITTACNYPAQTTTPVGTILPSENATSSPLPSTVPGSETTTALIPATGKEVVTMQCQFCVNTEPHALLILPERASFSVSEEVPGINCLTAKVENAQRVVVCRGSKRAAFTLNVCLENANCVQMPITLMDCPVNSNSFIQTPQATSVFFSSNAPTQVNTQIAPTVSASPATPLPTTTLAPVPLATATTVPLHPQPTKVIHGTPLVTPILPTGSVSGLQDPGEFVRWYFAQVWQVRDYQNLWDNYLTQNFKTYVSSGSFEEYSAWWSSVERVDVNSVNVIRNSGTTAWVRVNVTFTMKDGRVISNQEYDYALLYDAARQTWMFNYNP